MEPDRQAAAGFMYSDTGGDGAVVVLLHGVLTSGSLWDDVVEGLRDRYRCIVPELPFGAHRTPMPDDAALDLESIVKMIAAFLAELDVRDVTLVSNDWGGAQLVVCSGGSDRVANLVLVSCEAFDNYPPGLPGRLLCPQCEAARWHLLDRSASAAPLRPASADDVRRHVGEAGPRRRVHELDRTATARPSGAA
ncbi:alpha/beta fold hydrolase [Candidatus Poriferisodalis sp.]|uniref:alpha/beta fold hydrolase n=1 Tax=Candidatus Poriferisodalis sp. TaxID=3101277 RepID=UPI003B01CF89